MAGHSHKSGKKKKRTIEDKSPKKIAHLGVCPVHKVVAPYTCTYCVRNNPICEDVFCEICVSDRNRICVQIGKDHILCKLNKFMCNTHFDELANNVLIHKEDISPKSILYKGIVQSLLLDFFCIYHGFFHYLELIIVFFILF